MDIKVFGTNCPRCKMLEKLVKEVVSENDFQATISKVDCIDEMISYGIVRLPSIAIDGKVLANGIIPSKDEIKELIEGQIDG